MSTTFKPYARRLRRDQFARFAHPRRLCLRAERGSLWITVDGEPGDIELDAGASRVFDGPAAVLVGSLGGDAVFSAVPLPPAPAPGWTQRLRSWLHWTPPLAAAAA